MTWANEYRQGRVDQVEQQRIANLIAVSECSAASTDARNWAITEALKSLGFAPCSGGSDD